MNLIFRNLKSTEIALPWPPTVNTFWRSILNKKTGKIRVIVSAKGRNYRTEAVNLIRRRWKIKTPTTARLKIDILVCPADKRERDIDNLPKAVLDSFMLAGFYKSDSQIDELRLSRISGKSTKKGFVLVRIRKIVNSNEMLGFNIE